MNFFGEMLKVGSSLVLQAAHMAQEELTYLC